MRQGLVIAAVWAMALGLVAPSRAQAPKSAPVSGPPDVLVLIYRQPGKGDLVNITYAHTVPHAQVQHDLDALAQETGWPIGLGRVTDGAPPVQGKIGPMTSSVFTVPFAIRDETHTLPVEPFATAFRSYKRLNLIFSVGSGFQFQGLGSYADKDIQIVMEQHGTVYTYQINILNPHFGRLNLPQTQAATSTTSGAETVRRRVSPWTLFLGILAAAMAAGALAYVLMARKLPPLPPSPDALSEEQTKIGTKG